MEYTQDNPLVVVLPNSRWLRGDGEWASFLLRPKDRKQCCMGIAATQMGVTDYLLAGKKELHEVMQHLNGPLQALELAKVDVNNAALPNVYVYNDTAHYSDAKRVTRLNKYVNPFGLHFVFDPEG